MLRRTLVGWPVFIFIPLIGVSIVWWLANLSFTPEYGDTVEYYTLAKTLAVDSWRTVAYPILLRISEVGGGEAYSRVLIYLLQSSIAFLASCYFISTLGLLTGKRISSGMLAVMAGVLTAMPLITHFNLTILTDSLTASFFVISTSAFGRLLFSRKSDWLTLIIAALSFLATSLFRQERVIFYALFLLAILGLMFLTKKLRQSRLALIILLLFSIVTLAGLVNHRLASADLGRPPLTVTSSLFERIAQTRLSDNLGMMPTVIQERISPEMAKQWQADPGYTAVIWQSLSDEVGVQAMAQGSRTILSCCFVAVAGEITGDLLEYVFAPISYVRETLWVNVDPTRWTNTRLSMFRPDLSRVYLYHSFITLGVLIYLCWRARSFVYERRGVFYYFGSVVLIQALLFSLRSSLDFHIRYALPIYWIEIGILVFTAVVANPSKKIVGT